MDEAKKKKREWVKNAAIILLAVLLILTFFSNTILNRSLPEVSTRAISSGSVTARIRVNGTVAANQNYEVTVKESRKVRSVMVREGQEVSAGDVLFVLADGESEELEQAQDTLRDLQKSYQTALINATSSDYARENRDIRLAQENLEEAEAERDKLYVSKDALAQAEAYADATAQIAKQRRTEADTAQAALDRATEELRQMGVAGELNVYTLEELQADAEAKRAALAAANDALTADRLIHGRRYDWLEQTAREMIQNTPEYRGLPEEDRSREEFTAKVLPTYMDYIYDLLQNSAFENGDGSGYYSDAQGNRYALPAGEPVLLKEYSDAYNKITEDTAAIALAQSAYDTAARLYGRASEIFTQGASDLLAARDAAKEAAETAEDAQAEAEEQLQELKDKQAAYESAEKAVKDAQRSLEDVIFSLSEQKKTDGKTSQIEALELQDMKERIERQQKMIEELGDNASEQEVTAQVGGVIGSLAVTAGQTTIPDSPMATIELPDMGYTLNASVPNDQARRVHVGDTATVANVYWDTQIDATLTALKADPRDPQNSKLLTFELSGDVTPGSNLTLSVGQRSADYDYVVPNSALRSDSNGDFILVVEAKTSPLGDRYTATRVNVTKLTSDDTSTAVSGALNTGDFVITTSTAPVQNGDRVRLADSQN